MQRGNAPQQPVKTWTRSRACFASCGVQIPQQSNCLESRPGLLVCPSLKKVLSSSGTTFCVYHLIIGFKKSPCLPENRSSGLMS